MGDIEFFECKMCGTLVPMEKYSWHHATCDDCKSQIEEDMPDEGDYEME